MKRDYPILEFDPEPIAVLEPGKIVKPINMPQRSVLCFFHELLDRLADEGKLKVIAERTSEMGRHPIYELAHNGQSVTVFHPGVGAPLAAYLLEELIELGCNKFIACGGAGAIQPDIPLGHIVVPSSAVRDEGTSYHYLPPAREVKPSPSGVAAIEKVLKQRGVEYSVAKTWTTDGVYRETPNKVALRRSEGCLTVEMEAAAFFAVAQFRGVEFAQLLYAGDDVSSDKWDSRDWDAQPEIRENLFWLAVDACLEM